MSRFSQLVAALVFVFGLAPAAWAEQPKTSRFEKEITGFEEADKAKAPPKNAVLFVGSSSIRLWKLEQHFGGIPVINRGFGGSQIADSATYAHRIITKYEPKMIVFYAGDNDIASGKSPQQVRSDFEALVKEVRSKLPKTPIVFIAIKPSPSRWKFFENQSKANALVADYCRKNEGLHFLDVVQPMLRDGQPRPELFLKDQLHLNEDGYRLWTELVKPLLK